MPPINSYHKNQYLSIFVLTNCPKSDNVNIMSSIFPHAIRILPETNLKLRLISIHTRTSMCRIIENLVNDYWDKLENKPIIPKVRTGRARQLLKNFNIKFYEDEE